MATSTATSRPSPEHIFNTLNAFQQSAALKTAVELDIFSAIADGTNTAALLAAKTSAAERGVRILCGHLTIRGFLAQSNPCYSLSQDSTTILNQHTPASRGTPAHVLN